jgi:hypothetical protein
LKIEEIAKYLEKKVAIEVNTRRGCLELLGKIVSVRETDFIFLTEGRRVLVGKNMVVKIRKLGLFEKLINKV